MVNDEPILGPTPTVYERMYNSLKNITSKWFYLKETVDNKLSNKISKSSTNGFVKNDGSIASTIEARLVTSSSETIPLIAYEGNLGLDTNQVIINETIDGILEDINSDIDLMAHKSNGASEITDSSSNTYTNIGSMGSGATQKSINNKINIALGNKITNDTGAVSSSNIENNAITLTKINSEVFENIDNITNEFIQDYYNINLIPGAKEFEHYEDVAETNIGTLTGEYYHGYAIKRANYLTNTNNNDYTYYVPPESFKGGDKYNMSFWAKGSGSLILYFHGDSGYIPVKPIKSSNNITVNDNVNYGMGQCSCPLTANWQKYSVTYELDPEGTATNIAKRFVIRVKKSDAYICGVRMQKENDTSDYNATVHYSLTEKPDINNFQIGDELTINIVVKNANNEPVQNRSFRLYTYTDKGIFTSKNNGDPLDNETDTNKAITIKTNNNGLATATFECRKTGLVTFSAIGLLTTLTNKNIEEIKLPQIFIEEYDSGWVDIPFLNNSEFGNVGPNLQCRRIGKIVHIKGIVKNKIDLSNMLGTSGNDADAGKYIAQLPEEFRPTSQETSRNQASYGNTFLLKAISKNDARYPGCLHMSRYGYGSTLYNSLEAGRWLHMNMTYFVD